MEKDQGKVFHPFRIFFSLPAIVCKEFLEALEPNPPPGPTGSFMGLGFSPFPAGFCPGMAPRFLWDLTPPFGVKALEFTAFRVLELSPSRPKCRAVAESASSHFPKILGKPPLDGDDPSGKRFGIGISSRPRGCPGSCQRRFPSVPGKTGIIGPCLCRNTGISGKNPQGAMEKGAGEGRGGEEGMGMG